MNAAKSAVLEFSVGSELEHVAALVRAFTVQVMSRGGTSHGSGVVWHADGVVVTNAHVARDARLSVILGDDSALDARVVAIDRGRDLALLSVDAEGLPAARIGDPESLRAGSIVMALGHPLGVPNALSMGVVHTVTTERGMPRWIAADVRLAPGNSGGPLVDVGGRVVGINAMTAGGLGVAIASTVVNRFLRDLTRGGVVDFSPPLAA